jgi:hypothetical protein
MNLLRRSFSTLRTWLGLGDTSDDRLTPSHGWLLPATAPAVERQTDAASAPPEPRLR